jgi:hypothetical protein
MKAITYLLAVIIILTAGCGRSDKGKDTSGESPKQERSANEKIVARVNSKPIYETQLRDRKLNDIIADEILYDDALRQGLDKDKTIQNRLAQYRKNLYVNTLMGKDKRFGSQLANISKKQADGHFQKKNPSDRDESNIKKGKSEKPENANADAFIMQEGRRLGLDKDEHVQSRFENFKRRLILEQYKKDLIPDLAELGTVTQDQIAKYYRENQIKYTTLDLVFVSLDDREVAEEIHTRAKEGEDLKKLFEEYKSRKPESNIIFRKLFYNNQYSKLFSEKRIGSLSDVLKEGKNYKILKVTDIRVVPISNVTSEIKFDLLMEKRDQELRKIANSIAQKNNVKVETYAEDERI